MNDVRTWILGEEQAVSFLKKKGFKIVEKNCKIGGSEIDIVAILPKSVQKRQIIGNFKERKFDSLSDKRFFHKAIISEIKELQDMWVFVEVKARSSKKFGEPFEAVGRGKQHNLERGVFFYLKKNNHKNLPFRIDVVSVVDDEITHIENAVNASV
ncbi:MAG: YraN family protein [Clostridia bacterium]|nr:YraN family protein [Clostridia bacterium]